MAKGEIVINGSLPGKVLGPGEELLLTFRDGRLADMQPEDGPAARHLRATQIAYAERRGDPNWTNLAEIGFGLNPAIHDLTGVALVDEKKAHTVHIGLGHSTSLGGNVESVIHCDLVIERPTVYVNGRLILKTRRLAGQRGRLAAGSPHRGRARDGWWDGLGADAAQRHPHRARRRPPGLRLECRPRPLGQHPGGERADGAAGGPALRPAAGRTAERSARRRCSQRPSGAGSPAAVGRRTCCG